MEDRLSSSRGHDDKPDITTKNPVSMQDNESCDRCTRKLKPTERVIEIVERSHVRDNTGEVTRTSHIAGEKLLGRFCKSCERIVLAQMRMSATHHDAITLAMADGRVRQHLVPLWCSLPIDKVFNHMEVEWVDARSLMVTLHDMTVHRSSHYTFDVRKRELSPVAKRRAKG
jgi:hypothetical protein